MTSLPVFRSIRARRQHGNKQRSQESSGFIRPAESVSEKSLTPVSDADLKRATRARKHSIIASFVLLLIAIVFLILVIIGQTSWIPVLDSTWFFELDLTDVYPTAFGSTDLVFVNSIARSLGLHDYYRVGLWNFCEGYNDEGVTYCSQPQNLYWFNPVAILLNELLPGATIALPSDINTILHLIKLVSNIMFGFFMTGIIMCFISLPLLPLALYSRWWSLLISTVTFLAALLTTVATVIATVMFVIFRNVITSQAQLNIRAYLGRQMFAFMWTATACVLSAWIVQLCLACCCASRRDVRSGRKRGSQHSYSQDKQSATEGKKSTGKSEK